MWRVEFFFKINKRDSTFIREMRVADMFCKIVFFTNQWLKCGNNKINVSVTQTENPALHCTIG